MNYEALLRQHHLKATPQRLGILSIMDSHGHINVEELYVQIKKQFSSISLATLYKNINAMLEGKLISEVKMPHMKSKYEITKDEHVHMLCTQCEAVIDLELDMREFLHKASSKSHFTIESSSVVLSGICKACQNA